MSTNNLTLNIVTMTSLELVEFINSQRKEGDSELRHDHFMAKVPKVLGEEVAPNFRAYYTASNGKQNPCYRLPKREACLMAMSYSYELQAKVFDRMTELENQIAKPKLPVTYLEALKALVQSETEKAALETQKTTLEAKIEADAPKVEFHAEVTADKAAYLIRDAAKILEKKESELREILRSRRLIFQCRDGHWELYAEYIRRGWSALKIETINGHVIKFPVITGKGITAIRDRLARDDSSKHSDIPQTRNAIACNAPGSMVSR
ncbi:anti-repressor protein [Gammaproteobacteria bacterium]